MKDKYALQIFWSEEDKAFVAVSQDFPGLSAFGETREEALREAQIALNLMIETYQKNNLPLPNPKPILLEAA